YGVENGNVKKNGIKASELNPRLVFHNGIPSASISLAYDSIQNILAISTKDGRIKLLGKDNTQALLDSNQPLPSKFMQVWDIKTKTLAYVHIVNEDITAFTVIQQTSYVYAGNSVGNIIVLKLDHVTNHLQQMNYNIPLSASHGNTTEVADDTAVLYIMPQPKAESKRVLLIFRDGLIVLWGIEESKVLLVMGGNVLSISNESKKVTSACWACPFGSKLIVGYNTGEIYLWNVPSLSADTELPSAQNIPSYKLNLSYKMERIPILSLKWVYGDGKCSRLYINGFSNSSSSNMFQIVLLNEHTASRTIKLTLPLLEPCLDMEIISSAFYQNKQNQDSLLLVLKSGRLCTFDDYAIEKYLLQSQSRSPPSLPKQVMVRLPLADSSITIAKFITNNSTFMSGINEDYNMLMKSFPTLLPTEGRGKDGNSLISSIKQQSEDDHSSSGIPVTALYFEITSRNFVSGDQNGMVRIFKFKSEPFSTESNLFSLQGNVKKGSNQIIQSIKLIRVNGAVICIDVNSHSKHLAVGTDQGY
ncbi:Syntaxin-binding protein, partial [Thalictrum thalictroides]